MRLEREDLALDASHALVRELAHIVDIEHIALVGGQQRRETILGLLLLHHHQLGLGNQAVDDVILAQHFARLAVERLKPFVLVVDEIAVVLDARCMHHAAALINQRADIILALGRAMDLVEPGRCVATGQRIVRRLRSCRSRSQTQGQKKGPAKGPNSVCARYVGGRPSFMHVRHYSCELS